MVDADGNAIPGDRAGGVPADGAARACPSGLRGIVVAGLLAALMSSLAGVFNASSTLFTMDLYRKLRPRASQAQLVWVGRIATTVMVLIALAVDSGHPGREGPLRLPAGRAGLPGAADLRRVLPRRVHQAPQRAGLPVRRCSSASSLAMFRLAVDTPVSLGLAGFQDGYPAGSFLWIVNNIYFQYYSLLIFLICVATMVVVSYATPPPPEGSITGLTYATVTRGAEA